MSCVIRYTRNMARSFVLFLSQKKLTNNYKSTDM